MSDLELQEIKTGYRVVHISTIKIPHVAMISIRLDFDLIYSHYRTISASC
jgi:hypothetical protein